MFSTTDYDKLEQIMEESPEKRELLTRLLDSHKMTLSAISHEIRNPLTLVYSTLQLIESQHPEVTSIRHWDHLKQDVEYMNALLSELSAYNNSERLQITKLDSSDYFRRIALSFAASITDTPIVFTSQIPSDLPMIEADSLKLREVLFNLLANAKDAVLSSFEGAHINTPQITFSVRRKEQQLELSIHDNGCGIPEEDLSQIFEPFVTHKPQGTGLGLAITDRIIRSHKGIISVTSTPDVGTYFLLTLPIKQNC